MRTPFGKWGGLGSCLYLLAMSGLALVTSDACASNPLRYADVNIPVSLAVGEVKTDPFRAQTQYYDIMIGVDRNPENWSTTMCMLGIDAGPLQRQSCRVEDPVLVARWTVMAEGHVVASGISTPEGYAKVSYEREFKGLGGFMGQAGKSYVVHVEFIKDGSDLDAQNPHLIVIQHRHN